MRLFATLLLVLASSADLGAQTTPAAPGTRLRITVASPTARRETGSFTALTDTTLQLGAGARSVTIPLAAIARIERSGGKKRSLAGGIVGFVVGAAIGGAAGCLVNSDDYGVFCGGQSDTKVVAGVALGGVVGAALGALLLGGERWSPVSANDLR